LRHAAAAVPGRRPVVLRRPLRRGPPPQVLRGDARRARGPRHRGQDLAPLRRRARRPARHPRKGGGMSTTPITLTPADHYLAEGRRHLGARPDDERDDLLEDLDAHIHEVAAQDDRPLEEVLGPPEDFAAELIASAGLAPEAGEGPGATARAWERMQARVAAGRAPPWARAVGGVLPLLRAAGGGGRGWLAGSARSVGRDENTRGVPVPPLSA